MLFTHGPYRSAPEDRPFEVSMNQVGSHDNYELDAPFFYAMAIEADDQQVIDGGEVYQLRTENQFQINHSWRSTDIAQSVVVPEELRAPGVYADRVGVTHGLYNLTWPNEDFPMSPTIMRSTLRNALRSSSQPVWIFIESDETWLLPGGFPDQWRTNIENGFNDAFALNEVNVFRGVVVSGGLEEVRSSDDNYLLINPGFTLNASEAPAWIEFFGTVADDASVFAIESSAGTPNLLYTVEAWNWNNNQYDEVGTRVEQLNSDQVASFDLTAEHVGSGNAVRTRVGWRTTGFTINFPWVVRIDHASWAN